MMDEKIVLAIVGIIGGLLTFLQKVLYNQGKANYEIIVKLIDRFNKSDNRLEAMADQLSESADRRHEKIIDELNDLTDDINFVKGRLDGKS
jgi:predicted PurR-regulated permease PerM